MVKSNPTIEKSSGYLIKQSPHKRLSQKTSALYTTLFEITLSKSMTCL